MTEAPKAELDGDVLTVTMAGMSAGWEQWFLLVSDIHWDNPHCDRGLLKRHLQQAKERNAPVMCFGDFFDAMGGKYDPRASKENLRPEHQTAYYLDALVDTAVDWVEKELFTVEEVVDFLTWLLLTKGNHETGIEKHNETDLLQRVVSKLRAKGHNALGMGYSGFVRFLFKGRCSKLLYFHHGAGGGGVVTKGVIRSNRQAVYVPDADIVIGGHYHEQWLLTQSRVRMTPQGKWYLDNQYHLCSSTYKNEFDLAGGFHVERGRPPKPLGGWWLRFFYDESQRNRIGMEFTLAT